MTYHELDECILAVILARCCAAAAPRDAATLPEWARRAAVAGNSIASATAAHTARLGVGWRYVSREHPVEDGDGVDAVATVGGGRRHATAERQA